MSTPFVAVDGEACEGDYVSLQCSSLPPLLGLQRGGLGTLACLEYLLSIPKPSNIVCFGLGYDVNNWLRDLSRADLKRLWMDKVVYWKDYRIEWMPKRWFSVKSVDGRSRRVTEVFGFFQSSFVRALQAWNLGAPAEIQNMKSQRGEFKRMEIEEVVHYCQRECDLLVRLMEAVRAACVEASITPESWIGAGAIATALLNRQRVKTHHRYDLDLANADVAINVICGAYFGGRVELLRQGVHHGVVAADLVSAYPAAIRHLPSLKGARLEPRKRFCAGCPGIWKVSWDLRRRSLPARQVAPLPVRHKKSIFYPLAGNGYYHSVEVSRALDLGYALHVEGGYVLNVGETASPFAWVPEVFATRLQFKREARAAEKMVKLGLNSVYGKLAQGVGHRRRPPFQSYFWAGQVTATTRAAVLEAAVRARNPIMIATDGIYAEQFESLDNVGGLGTWECGEVDRLFAAQPGVYEVLKDGVVLHKSRGFFAREIDYGELREGWEVEGSNYVYHYSSTRFQGLGSSLARKDFSVWRRWIAEPRSILLLPERKIGSSDGDLLPFPGPLTSQPYVPKQDLIEQRALDDLEGFDQPMVAEI